MRAWLRTVARQLAQTFDRLDRLIHPPLGGPMDRAYLAGNHVEDTWAWRWLSTEALQDEMQIRAVQLWLTATYREIELGGVPSCSTN